ncbi:LCP family protein [Vagococcus vulneris]|uniref:Cell envelope-related transcriptional attenuator domain-containing protein n=1 Tax=Vagococcus vulneris TaxID=1977869 RepID=A0A429ZZV8_9ENTE|nr:LCP family protein [Vagococcus vulneris]RST99556.1 hypothetical protein CBF37_04310 [Vagococcus vulneris]
MTRKNKKNQIKKDDVSVATENSRVLNQRRQKRQSKSKRVLVRVGQVLSILFLVAILGLVGYGIKMFSDANKFLNDSYHPRTASKSINDNIDVQKDPISILVLGLDDNDERNLGSARTDSMLLLTLDPTKEIINTVSIPRDTYTQINSKEFKGKDKINAAYSYGGIDTTIDTVENLINVPINYYTTVDFEAFEEIVNALGGVEIEVPFTLTEQNAKGKKVVQLKEGKHKLNGEQALAFSRTRYIDNDVERGKRQQQVLEAVANKAMAVGSIAKYKSILNALDGHIQTDMPSDKILSVAQSGLTKNYKFHSYTFSWMSYDYAPYGETMSMVGLHKDSIDYISHKLRLSLGLDKPDDRDVAGYKFQSDGIVDPNTYPQDGLAIDN